VGRHGDLPLPILATPTPPTPPSIIDQPPTSSNLCPPTPIIGHPPRLKKLAQPDFYVKRKVFIVFIVFTNSLEKPTKVKYNERLQFTSQKLTLT
jgi:hypothetical protein